MTVEQASDLKKRLAEATDYGAFHEYFLTNFVERGNFMRMGRKLSSPVGEFLGETLAAAYRQYSGEEEVKVTGMLIEVPDLKIIHGPMHVNGKIASVLYFEDIQLGMFAVVKAMQEGMWFMRFSAVDAAGKPN